jgi:hypothetical protein
MLTKFETKSQIWLGIILIASIISTARHDPDNFRFNDQYPEPDWISLPSIYISWTILTAIGILGYGLYHQRKLLSARICLAIYSLTGLSSLAHYFYGAMSEFSLKMHFLILIDGLTGLAVLSFVIWSTLDRSHL